MGWNDRLMEDPYIPPPEYYRARDEYEMWLEYVEARLNEEKGLTSQNLDPLTLTTPTNGQNTDQVEKENRIEEKDRQFRVQGVEANAEERATELPF